MQARESVLVHGASGGVGITACQTVRANGLKVWGTAGTEERQKLFCSSSIGFRLLSSGSDENMP